MSVKASMSGVEAHMAYEGMVRLLEKLAGGETVQLGTFSDNGGPVTEADEMAARLHDLVAELRGEGVPAAVHEVAEECDRDAGSGSSTFLQKVYVYEAPDGHRWMCDDDEVYTSLEEIPAPE